MTGIHARSLCFGAVIGVASALLACGVARANAASAEYAAGGLVFKPSADISMASEDLYLSLRQVQVSYVFHSSASATQDLLLAFPLPAMPINAGGVDVVDLESGVDASAPGAASAVPNYVDFRVSVNGVPVRAHATGRAVLDGRDVSSRLRDAGMPLVFGEELDVTSSAMALPTAVRAQLVSEGLLAHMASMNPPYEPDSYSPQWQYQATFEWRQQFAPGDTRVEISYAPQLGDIVDISGDPPEYMTGTGAFADYCIDAGVRGALARYTPAHWDISTLGYVVTTARYWKGPIGRFHLVVEKPSAADLVAFCPADAKKASPTRFEWTRTDYVPKQDIKVMFFFATEDD